MGKRDTVLDEIRTLLAVYTIWAHSLSWNGVLSTEASPINFNIWGLTPMVSFFFLIGASNAMGKKRTLRDFYGRRLSRIYTPYIFYAFASIVLCCAFLSVSGEKFPLFILDTMRSDAQAVGNGSIHLFSPGSPLYWLFPLDKCLIPVPQELGFLVYHLWFLPVYVAVILLFPLLRICYEKLRCKWVPFVVLMALMVVFRMLKILYWPAVSFTGPVWIGIPMSILCFCFWAYLGLFYQRLRHPTRRIKKWAAIIGISGVLLIIVMLKIPWGLSKLGIQTNAFWTQFFYFVPGGIVNHFPPNLMFMAYNIAAFPLLYLGAPYILRAVRFLRKKVRFIDAVFSLYENSYLIIYLFSSFAFLLVNWTLDGLGVYDAIVHNEFAGALILQCIMIPVCGLFGKWLAPLENIRFRLPQRKGKNK